MLAGTLCRTKLALVELGYPEPAAVLAGAEHRGPLAAWYIDESAAELQDREHALTGASVLPRPPRLRAHCRPGLDHDV